jgi:methionine synthase / methylenetetrahydrofolate reductase(NADPH)
VRLAREAAREHAFVAGAIGPLGAHIEPLGPTSFAEARAIFREQVDVLLEAGVDLLVLETFGNLDEMREALFAAREAAGPDMTIVAQVTIDDNGNLPGGTETEVFTRPSTNGRPT